MLCINLYFFIFQEFIFRPHSLFMFAIQPNKLPLTPRMFASPIYITTSTMIVKHQTSNHKLQYLEGDISSKSGTTMWPTLYVNTTRGLAHLYPALLKPGYLGINNIQTNSLAILFPFTIKLNPSFLSICRSKWHQYKKYLYG